MVVGMQNLMVKEMVRYNYFGMMVQQKVVVVVALVLNQNVHVLVGTDLTLVMLLVNDHDVILGRM
jgi:hypothetical protein